MRSLASPRPAPQSSFTPEHGGGAAAAAADIVEREREREYWDNEHACHTLFRFNLSFSASITKPTLQYGRHRG